MAILTHGAEALEFLSGVDESAFREDRLRFHAVTRCLEIVSEASRRLSAETKASDTRLDWRAIADAGNYYRHQYEGVAADFVFRTATNELPKLIAAVQASIDAP